MRARSPVVLDLSAEGPKSWEGGGGGWGYYAHAIDCTPPNISSTLVTIKHMNPIPPHPMAPPNILAIITITVITVIIFNILAVPFDTPPRLGILIPPTPPHPPPSSSSLHYEDVECAGGDADGDAEYDAVMGQL